MKREAHTWDVVPEKYPPEFKPGGIGANRARNTSGSNAGLACPTGSRRWVSRRTSVSSGEVAGADGAFGVAGVEAGLQSGPGRGR